VAGTGPAQAAVQCLLKALLDDLHGAPGQSGHGAADAPRGILDDPEYLAVIEERAASSWPISTCFGSRLFWQDG